MRRRALATLAVSAALHGVALAGGLALAARQASLTTLFVDLTRWVDGTPSATAARGDAAPQGDRRAPGPAPAPRARRAREDAPPAAAAISSPPAEATTTHPAAPAPAVPEPRRRPAAPVAAPGAPAAPPVAPSAPTRRAAASPRAAAPSGRADGAAPRGDRVSAPVGGTASDAPGGFLAAAAPAGDGAGTDAWRAGSAGRSIGAAPDVGLGVARATPGVTEDEPGVEYGPYLSRLRDRVHEALRYPRAARRRGEQGTVELEIVVRPDGTLGEVTVAGSSSHPVLDDAALAAARRVAAEPFPAGLAPRLLRVRLPVVFRLE